MSYYSIIEFLIIVFRGKAEYKYKLKLYVCAYYFVYYVHLWNAENTYLNLTERLLKTPANSGKFIKKNLLGLV